MRKYTYTIDRYLTAALWGADANPEAAARLLKIAATAAGMAFGLGCYLSACALL